LTGEPKHQEKHPIDSIDQPNTKTDVFLLGGSTLMQGTGVGIVCAVGKNS